MFDDSSPRAYAWLANAFAGQNAPQWAAVLVALVALFFVRLQILANREENYKTHALGAWQRYLDLAITNPTLAAGVGRQDFSTNEGWQYNNFFAVLGTTAEGILDAYGLVDRRVRRTGWSLAVQMHLEKHRPYLTVMSDAMLNTYNDNFRPMVLDLRRSWSVTGRG